MQFEHVLRYTGSYSHNESGGHIMRCSQNYARSYTGSMTKFTCVHSCTD